VGLRRDHVCGRISDRAHVIRAPICCETNLVPMFSVSSGPSFGPLGAPDHLDAGALELNLHIDRESRYHRIQDMDPCGFMPLRDVATSISKEHSQYLVG
jgi:hypothetical protein